MIIGKRKLLAHSLHGSLHIDEDFAMSEFARYTQTLALIKSGLLDADESSKEPVEVSNVVPLKGTMFVEDTWCDYGALSIVEQLQALDANPDFSYGILQVNSGGGMSQAGYLVRDAVSNMKKPVYAYVIQAGSAALNAISTCEKIFMANEASQIGSIGSYFSINKKVVEEYIATFDEVYATQSEEKNGAIRAYVKGDKSILVKEATSSAQQFIESISKTRNIALDSPVMKGGMYYAKEAIDLGLADEIVGTMADIPKALKTGNQTKKLINNNNSVHDMKGIITALNRIFGWSLKEDSTEASLQTQLDSQESLASLVTSAVGAQVKALSDSVTEFASANKTLTESVAKLTAEMTSLKESQATLQSENAKLLDSEAKVNAAKKLLEEEILQLKSAREGQQSNDFQKVESEFLGTLTTFKVSVA